MGDVAGARRPDVGTREGRAQQAIAGQVVVAQAGEHRELDVLVATEILDDPFPAAGNARLTRRRVRARLEQRVVDRVHVGDERAEAGEFDGRGGVQHDGDLARGVGEMVAEAVMKRLDRVADRRGVEEVDKEPVARLPAAVRRGLVHVEVVSKT
jgi:hypothetical protein